ncbi:unnamed protein product [Rhizoctonia solani]|uniref:Uncharacterized protein n=1 Tax=Rhizoctonia solani TaxID=456999 RepID=A0A8H3BGN8_9AGAM|nr:unnamed protein product [Rhizoctonia solani]
MYPTAGKSSSSANCPVWDFVNTLMHGLGDIYLSVNIISSKEVSITSQLRYESTVYERQSGVGVPSIWWFGSECDYNAMVLDLLSPSLEDLFNFYDCKFPLEPVLLLAISCRSLTWNISIIVTSSIASQ